MTAKWQRFRVDVPDDFSPGMREALGKEVVEFIRRRTESGKDKNDERFIKYSKAYINSKDFKNAGKSPSKVNLTLSGDMLIALDILSHKSGSVLIGFENGTEENARADGNVQTRDFMGIKDKDLDKLIDKVRENYGQ